MDPSKVESIINLRHYNTNYVKKMNSQINFANRQFSLIEPQKANYKHLKDKSDEHLERNIKHYQWIEHYTNIFIKILQSN
jgi:hypothetical protein